MGNHLWFWALLTLPAVLTMTQFVVDSISYGQTVIRTGLWSAVFLLAAVSVTPLQRIIGSNRLVEVLKRHRRALGVASFGYAAVHTAVYLERKGDAGLILQEALDPALATGWLALLVLLILAATSNDASVRALGRRWKRIHRSVYLGTGLTFAHWILGTVSPMVAFICLALLLIAEVLRIADIRVLKQDG